MLYNLLQKNLLEKDTINLLMKKFESLSLELFRNEISNKNRSITPLGGTAIARERVPRVADEGVLGSTYKCCRVGRKLNTSRGPTVKTGNG